MSKEFEKVQAEVDEWIQTVGVRYFNELTNMAQLTEETGEVARIIARRYGEQSEKPADKEKDLGEELADVIFVAVCLANQTGVDLQKAWDQKLKLKTERDRKRHKNNEKLKWVNELGIGTFYSGNHRGFEMSRPFRALCCLFFQNSFTYLPAIPDSGKRGSGTYL